MAESVFSFGETNKKIEELSAHLGTLDYLKNHVRTNSTDFTSWQFQVAKQTGSGLLLGFDEVWAFSYAPTDSIGAKQVARAMRSQGDRGFTFAYNSSTGVITVTTTGTVWGGATVFLN